MIFAVPSAAPAHMVIAANTADFTMSAQPNSLTIPQGSSGSSIIFLTSVNGFQGNVGLTPPVSCLAIGCPSYTINPTRVSLAANGSGKAVFTIYTYSQTPLNTYNVAVSGTSGNLSHTTSVTYTVIPPQSGPDFSISANPANENVVSGSSCKSLTIMTRLNGFIRTAKCYTYPTPCS